MERRSRAPCEAVTRNHAVRLRPTHRPVTTLIPSVLLGYASLFARQITAVQFWALSVVYVLSLILHTIKVHLINYQKTQNRAFCG